MNCPLRRVVSYPRGWLQFAVLIGSTVLSFGALEARGADSNGVKLVVVLYPENNDGSPGNFQVDQAIRATFASNSTTAVSIYSEYLDVTILGVRTDVELPADYASTARRRE